MTTKVVWTGFPGLRIGYGVPGEFAGSSRGCGITPAIFWRRSERSPAHRFHQMLARFLDRWLSLAAEIHLAKSPQEELSQIPACGAADTSTTARSWPFIPVVAGFIPLSLDYCRKRL